jgi:hypothetical protein
LSGVHGEGFNLARIFWRHTANDKAMGIP